MQTILAGNWIQYLSLGFLVPYFLAVGIHFLAEPMRWTLYTYATQGIQLKRPIQIFCFTALLTYLLPFKMGLPARIYLLSKKMSLSLSDITAHMALDGFLYYGFWALSALFGLSYLALTGVLPTEFSSHSWLAIGIMTGIMFISIAARKWKKPSSSAQDSESTTNRKFSSRVWSTSTKILATCNSHSRRILLSASGIVVLDICSHILRHWALFSMINVELSLAVIAALTCISIFVGLASMMPMGLGGYDLSLALLLAQFGIPWETSLLVPIINRVGNISFSVLVGVWSARGLDLNPLGKRWRSAI